jgi:hypothetical protein
MALRAFTLRKRNSHTFFRRPAYPQQAELTGR